jgi:hypothetical protein
MISCDACKSGWLNDDTDKVIVVVSIFRLLETDRG